jgi:putative hemolysin
MMNRFYLILPLVLAACAGTYNSPPSPTDKPNEYIVQVVDDHFVASSLEAARQGAINSASEHCAKFGKVYEKIYQLDKPFKITNRPESILRFRCIDRQ